MVSLVKDITIGGGDVAKVTIGEHQPLTLIGGPCAIESEEHALFIAKELKAVTESLGVQFIYKSCYDKDCRSSSTSFHGLGVEEGLQVLQRVREVHGVPVNCDVSNVEWMEATAKVVDFIQIPAYLCRQTHLLKAAGKTGRAIHIKKGQFMSPWNMRNSAQKVASTGNQNILLTDRGTFFGYNMLVSDMRCLQIMKETGYPVCYDATHSIQMPSALGTMSGGQREFIPALVRAAMAAGANALFMEIHDEPDRALSDPATQIHLRYVKEILRQAKMVYDLVREVPLMEIENYSAR
ncbi:3-deoxy-8-phosphooctulonate synthase [Candidatus Uhrbacteria bacterium]|nr:3-deoxy-8-phosphooctulonate synthase [Candidatus Uhrbacteria bacterium]